ncbi:MAG: hypothetical protein WC565_03705 [Parcubacteria group bacterium]
MDDKLGRQIEKTLEDFVKAFRWLLLTVALVVVELFLLVGIIFFKVFFS